MEDSYARLLRAAKELRGAKNEAAVASLLNISEQALHNWKSRGVPRRNLIEIEARIGAYPRWIATGEGDMNAGMWSNQSTESLIFDVINAMRFMAPEDVRLMAELSKRFSKEKHNANIQKKTPNIRKPASAHLSCSAAFPFWSDRRTIERRTMDNPTWHGTKDRRKYERNATNRQS
ncbi:helix-turn-helix domain-containing protein [Nitrosospira sp. NpAV]|uniref:helix-turn-helix domain-containing protein n=1 Tax=Nitrosospira sp. NpAV TaxID=58133 RepID=UPI000696FEB7|nr:helix-turn-helix domain-containing protein [Nitrosospira sp. NpAV]